MNSLSLSLSLSLYLSIFFLSFSYSFFLFFFFSIFISLSLSIFLRCRYLEQQRMQVPSTFVVVNPTPTEHADIGGNAVVVNPTPEAHADIDGNAVVIPIATTAVASPMTTSSSVSNDAPTTPVKATVSVRDGVKSPAAPSSTPRVYKVLRTNDTATNGTCMH